MLTSLRAPTWPRRKTSSPSAAKENRSESDPKFGPRRALYLAGASADDLLEAEALRRESLTGGAAVLDASHEEYVRREELVAAAREVGWEPFSCEEIRAVTLER